MRPMEENNEINDERVTRDKNTWLDHLLDIGEFPFVGDETSLVDDADLYMLSDSFVTPSGESVVATEEMFASLQEAEKKFKNEDFSYALLGVFPEGDGRIRVAYAILDNNESEGEK